MKTALWVSTAKLVPIKTCYTNKGLLPEKAKNPAVKLALRKTYRPHQS